MTDLSGKSIGRYHLLEPLGEGGMAVVYKAYDTRLECEVAVKFIRMERLAPEVAGKTLKRFEQEAKALARLSHPNIVKVTDFGESEGMPYLVLPYLPGGTLKQRLQGKPMPYQEAASLLIPIARALGYAHEQGMIHRDVKPSNILITHSGDPMLSDFGIAKIIDEEATMDLTGTSAAVGTPEYMAPEQVTSKSVDRRADIYALGIVFYEMVTGRRPYQADTPMAVLFKHASEPLPRPQSFVPDLPDAVERVLLKALTKKPEDRFQNMGEFARALEGLAGTIAVPTTKKPELPLKREEASVPRKITTKKPEEKPSAARIILTLTMTLIVLVLGIESTTRMQRNVAIKAEATQTAQALKAAQTATIRAYGDQVTMQTFTIDAQKPWNKTGIEIRVGDRIIVTQTAGTWSVDSRVFEFVNGNGYASEKPIFYCGVMCTAPIKDGVLGSLVARIGKTTVGLSANGNFVADEKGLLMLMINDAYESLHDNDGSITVSVTVYRP